MFSALCGMMVLVFGFMGCGSKKNPAGLQDFHLNVKNGRIHLAFVSTAAQWDVGVTLPVPQLGDATLSIQPDVQSSGVIFGFSAEIDQMLSRSVYFENSALPDGRLIPGVVGGHMRRTDVQVRDDYLVSMYFSNEAFGFYAPIRFSKKEIVKFLFKPLRFWITDPKGNRMGRGYVMPPTSSDGTGAGVMILLPFLGSAPDTES